MEIQEKVLGPEHPDVATSYDNIRNVYSHQGDYLRALDWYRKALAILEKVFGPDHPDMAILYSYISLCYYNLAKENPRYITILNEFMEDKVWTATVVEGDTPAKDIGLSAEYYILEFGDWNWQSPKSLFDISYELQGKPKDIVIIKDGKISRYHFEDKIGVTLGIKKVGKEESRKAKYLYQQWKSNQ